MDDRGDLTLSTLAHQLLTSVVREVPVRFMRVHQPSPSAIGNVAATRYDNFAGRLTKLEPNQVTSWIISALEGVAAHRSITAHTQLFSAGDGVRSYFVLLFGTMLVYRPGTQSHKGRVKAAIRFLSADEPFIFDCDGKHVAHCVAISDCDLLCIDRSKLDRLASANIVLRGILNRVHANEIDWLQQAAGAYDGISQDDQPDQAGIAFVTDLSIKRRHRKGTAS